MGYTVDPNMYKMIPVCKQSTQTNSHMFSYMRTCMPEAGIEGRDKQLDPTVYLKCNYLSLPLIPASVTQILISEAAI